MAGPYSGLSAINRPKEDEQPQPALVPPPKGVPSSSPYVMAPGAKPAQPAPPQAPPVQPSALSPAMAAPAPVQGGAVTQGQPALAPQENAPPDPEQARQTAIETAKQSAEAVKTAPAEHKDEVNKQLEEIGGGHQSLADAYLQTLEKLGGEKELDLKLTKQDWGLFLMDFGMRMMAASGDWRGSTLSHAGEAGAGTLGDYQADQDSRRKGTDSYNENQRKSALEIASKQYEIDNPKVGATSAAGRYIQTDKGLIDPRTGKYVLDENGERVMKAATGNGPHELEREYRYKSLVASGMEDWMARRMSTSDAPSPESIRFEMIQALERRAAQDPYAKITSPIDGKQYKIGELPEAAKRRYLEDNIKLVWQKNKEAAAQGKGALNDATDAAVKGVPGLQ